MVWLGFDVCNFCFYLIYRSDLCFKIQLLISTVSLSISWKTHTEWLICLLFGVTDLKGSQFVSLEQGIKIKPGLCRSSGTPPPKILVCTPQFGSYSAPPSSVLTLHGSELYQYKLVNCYQIEATQLVHIQYPAIWVAAVIGIFPFSF